MRVRGVAGRSRRRGGNHQPRRNSLAWRTRRQGKTASWLREALKSPSEVGPFPLSWLAEVPGRPGSCLAAFATNSPRRCLKPAAVRMAEAAICGCHMQSRTNITGARALSDRIVLDLDTGAATFDHVLLGTGYRIDLRASWHFVAAASGKNRLASDGSPLLGHGFESSAPKLHFVGSYAVRSFGPLLRFIAGAPFAARSVTGAAQRGSRGSPPRDRHRGGAALAA